MRLEGKVALITGAGSSVGLAIAHRFAAEGAKIVIADIAHAEDAAAKLDELGHAAIGVRTDISSEADVENLARQAIAKFGQIDILVNNAALASANAEVPFEEITVEQWRRMFDVNAMGMFLCCRAVVPHMRRRKYGRIVNFASTTVQKGVPYQLHYVSSKGAVIALTRSLAREVGPDMITVNAIAPGYTLSEGNLNNPELVEKYASFVRASRSIPRDAYQDDLMGGVVFLSSDDAAFISGQTLNIEGGSIFR